MDGPFPDDLLPRWEGLTSRPELLKLDPVTGVCEAIFDDPLLFPLQRRREMAQMLELVAARRPRFVAEIGADKGGGLAHWAMLPTVRRVLACEVRGCPYKGEMTWVFPDVDLDFWERSSRPAPGVRQPIDVLFIDGDKANFEQDFDAWLPLMAPGGLVLMHDVADELPGRAFGRVAGRGYRHERILDTSEAALALDLQEAGVPPRTAHEGWLRHWRGASCGVGVIYL